ncbi:MAG: YHS domain-containing protein [Deltaproteobacteria bacterium]|jgi:YHS domain-containing protein|nr:YHS domain-containing protein [Deltaproteobacteria bacterium]
MKRFQLILFLGVIFGLLSFGWSMPGIALAAPQTKCPVLGNKINKKVFVDYHGKRVYFCCPVCEAQFKKNPEKYLQKMKAEGVTPTKTP